MEKLLDALKNLKFKHKLIISYIIVIIIPLATLGAYSYSQARGFLLQQARMNLTDTIKKVADNINYKFNKYNVIIDSITNNSRVVQLFNSKYTDEYLLYKDLTETIDPLFYNILTINDDVAKIWIYTGNNIPERTNSIYSIDRVKNEKWYSNEIKNTVTRWVSEKDKLFGVRRLMEQYKSPIHNLLYLEIDYQRVFNTLMDEKLKDYGIIIADLDGKVIFSQERLENNEISIQESDIIQCTEDEITIGNKKFMLIKSNISEPSWVIYYYKPVASIGINAKNIITATVFIIGGCLVIAALLIWMFSSTFVKRIDELNQKVKLVATGSLKLDIHSKSRDEIGELTNGVGEMLKSINSLIHEVYHSRIVQKEAEMKALQAQINPHFLYNTLSLINWKAIRIRSSEISYITTTLSKFYRTTLNKGKNVISIRDEIENTRAYMEIQLIMHDHSFDVTYDLEEGIYPYDMINLVLQPIVENAIEHGVDRIENGRGSIRISGCLVDDRIEFLVEDNGPGMEQEVAFNILTTHSIGYGIKNVNDRIQLFFGDEYGITIESKPDSGTRVKIVLPQYKAGPEIKIV